MSGNFITAMGVEFNNGVKNAGFFSNLCLLMNITD